MLTSLFATSDFALFVALFSRDDGSKSSSPLTKVPPKASRQQRLEPSRRRALRNRKRDDVRSRFLR